MLNRGAFVYLVLAAPLHFTACQTAPTTDTPTAEIDPSCESSCYYYTRLTKCVKGICVCKNTTLTWYSQNHECALPVGSACSLNDTRSDLLHVQAMHLANNLTPQNPLLAGMAATAIASMTRIVPEIPWQVLTEDVNARIRSISEQAGSITTIVRS